MRKYFKLLSEMMIYRLFLVFIYIMRCVGIDRASRLCGFSGRIIGPYTQKGWVVRNNLKFIYKEIDQKKLLMLEAKIWDNFGRYIGEFAFIDELYLKSLGRVEIVGDAIPKRLAAEGKKYIIFSGHFANWDYILYALLSITGESGIVYRKINNRFIDTYVHKKRSMLNSTLIKKGIDGSREIIKVIKSKKNLMMLVDQKMNEGIRIPLLDKPANTSTGIASIARQYGYDILPLRIERLDGAYFRITFNEPLEIEQTPSKDQDIYNTTVKINHILSDWITQAPEQWLWQHQRWGKPHEMK